MGECCSPNCGGTSEALGTESEAVEVRSGVGGIEEEGVGDETAGEGGGAKGTTGENVGSCSVAAAAM